MNISGLKRVFKIKTLDPLEHKIWCQVIQHAIFNSTGYTKMIGLDEKKFKVKSWRVIISLFIIKFD